MPGVYQWTVERLPAEVEAVAGLGIPAVILFGIPEGKTLLSGKLRLDGIVQGAIRSIKAAVPELLVVPMFVCASTPITGTAVSSTRGHPLPPSPSAEGYVLNDPTLEVLGGVAVSHAEAGADIVASGMMDGMVAAIRSSLDATPNSSTSHLSYAVKYASAFYGPFRDAAESSRFGDRSRARWTRPMPAGAPGAGLDVAKGADMLMVKPALPYLDVIHRGRRHHGLPFAYNVSGEYAMLKAAAANGWIDERTAVLEALTGIKRAAPT